MLFPDSGGDIPVVMTITAFARNGRTVQVWDRAFAFPNPRRFVADIVYDPRTGAITERFGLGGMLELRWRIRFKPPDKISIRGSKWWLRLGPVRVPLPVLLTGKARASQCAELGSNVVHLKLSVHNPLIGRFFGYEGRFTVRRVPAP